MTCCVPLLLEVLRVFRRSTHTHTLLYLKRCSRTNSRSCICRRVPAIKSYLSSVPIVCIGISYMYDILSTLRAVSSVSKVWACMAFLVCCRPWGIFKFTPHYAWAKCRSTFSEPTCEGINRSIPPRQKRTPTLKSQTGNRTALSLRVGLCHFRVRKPRPYPSNPPLSKTTST